MKWLLIRIGPIHPRSAPRLVPFAVIIAVLAIEIFLAYLANGNLPSYYCGEHAGLGLEACPPYEVLAEVDLYVTLTFFAAVVIAAVVGLPAFVFGVVAVAFALMRGAVLFAWIAANTAEPDTYLIDISYTSPHKAIWIQFELMALSLIGVLLLIFMSMRRP